MGHSIRENLKWRIWGFHIHEWGQEDFPIREWEFVSRMEKIRERGSTDPSRSGGAVGAI